MLVWRKLSWSSCALSCFLPFFPGQPCVSHGTRRTGMEALESEASHVFRVFNHQQSLLLLQGVILLAKGGHMSGSNALLTAENLTEGMARGRARDWSHECDKLQTCHHLTYIFVYLCLRPFLGECKLHVSRGFCLLYSLRYLQYPELWHMEDI